MWDDFSLGLVLLLTQELYMGTKECPPQVNVRQVHCYTIVGAKSESAQDSTGMEMPISSRCSLEKCVK